MLFTDKNTKNGSEMSGNKALIIVWGNFPIYSSFLRLAVLFEFFMLSDLENPNKDEL